MSILTDTADEGRRKAIFDPTINLGHILTALTMLAAGFTAYNNLDKRVSGLEQLSAQMQVQRAEKDQILKETLVEMRGDIKETRRSIEDLSRSITQTLNEKHK